MPTDTAPLLLLFLEWPEVDLRRAARVLSTACPGLTEAQALQSIRSGQGFVELQLPQPSLRAACEALMVAGFPMALLPASERASPPLPLTLTRVRLEPAALVPLQPSASPLPWYALRRVHLACVQPASAAGAPGPATLPRGLGALEQQAGRARESSGPGADLWLELLGLEPLLRARISMNSFLYDCLPGPLALQGHDNFRQLLLFLSERLPHARHSGLVEALVRSSQSEALGAPCSEEEHERAIAYYFTRDRILATRSTRRLPSVAPSSAAAPARATRAVPPCAACGKSPGAGLRCQECGAVQAS